MTLPVSPADLAADRRNGMKSREIARKYDCSLVTVYRLLRQGGFEHLIRVHRPPVARIKRVPNSAAMSREPIGASDMPRVSRDPCTYCGVRADFGCQHNRSAA